MNRPTLHPRRWAWALALALATGACQDSLAPAAGGGADGPAAPGGPSAPPVSLQELACTGDLSRRVVSCGGESAPADSGKASIVFGGQNVYIKLTSANPSYDAGTEEFTFTVTVRNLIPQPLGTADTLGTLVPEPDGVRVFFIAPPTVTSGTGLVSVVGDGAAVITGAQPQAYYQYNTVLEQYEVSAPKTWTLKMPPTVGTFAFKVLVSAPVPWPNGYVDILGNFNVRSGEDRTYTAVPRNALGVQDAAPIPVVFASADTTRAAPVVGTGTMHGLRAGSTFVQAFAADGRTGKAELTVRPRRRIWKGTTSTDWNDGTNWFPDNVSPVAQDTVVLSDTVMTVLDRYPILVENEQIAGIEVQKGSIALNSFNLTATGDVYTQTPGLITSSSGRLVLSGIARTVRGNLPRLLVNGTYSLDGNVVVNQQIRVQGGRLRNQYFRVRVVPN